MSNEKGFALLLLLSILFLFISVWMAIFGLGHYIKNKQNIDLQCQRAVLEAQDLLLQGGAQAKMLNEAVEGLVVAYYATKVLSFFVTIPLLKIALRVGQKYIRKFIQLANKAQKAFIKVAQMRALWVLQHARVRMIQTGRTFLQSLHSNSIAPWVHLSSAKIMLQKQRLGGIADIFVEPDDFADKQRIHIWFSAYNLNPFSRQTPFPEWMTFLKELQFKWREQCHSKPYKYQNHWISALTEDNS